MNELSIFDSLFNDCMENAFGFSGKRVFAPKVDVTESEKSYTIEMELPGRDEKSVDIQIEKGVLTISSKSEENSGSGVPDGKAEKVKAVDGKAEKTEKSSEDDGGKENAVENRKKTEGRKYLVRERKVFEFSRSFSLPEDVDEENASASFRNGILSVILPRKEKPLPKKISVKVA